MKTARPGAGHAAAVPRLLLSLVPVVFYVLLVWLAARPAAGWYALSRGGEEGLNLAAGYEPGNAVFPYLLGRHYDLDMENPDPERASSYYRRALALNPLQPGAWAGLSTSLLHAGKAADAAFALERAVLLNPSDPSLMWEASTFWLMNGEVDRAVTALRQFIRINPEGQVPVYDLCWKLRLENAYLLKNLLPEEYAYRKKYLEYLMAAKKTAEAQEVWALMDAGNAERDLFIRYVDFLIDNGLYTAAERPWRDVAARAAGIRDGDPLPLIWNADFEQELLNGGFGWSVNETKGVDAFLDDFVHMTGNRSLGVTFNGEENPDVTIARQVVKLTPGTKYSLRGYIKTQALTTTNGIFLSVEGHRCSGLGVRSETVTGTNFWKEAVVDFDVPKDCEAAVVRIRRERSQKLDNKIAGTAWIDGLSLKERSGGMTTASSRR